MSTALKALPRCRCGPEIRSMYQPTSRLLARQDLLLQAPPDSAGLFSMTLPVTEVSWSCCAKGRVVQCCLQYLSGRCSDMLLLETVCLMLKTAVHAHSNAQQGGTVRNLPDMQRSWRLKLMRACSTILKSTARMMRCLRHHEGLLRSEMSREPRLVQNGQWSQQCNNGTSNASMVVPCQGLEQHQATEPGRIRLCYACAVWHLVLSSAMPAWPFPVRLQAWQHRDLAPGKRGTRSASVQGDSIKMSSAGSPFNKNIVELTQGLFEVLIHINFSAQGNFCVQPLLPLATQAPCRHPWNCYLNQVET